MRIYFAGIFCFIFIFSCNKITKSDADGLLGSSKCGSSSSNRSAKIDTTLKLVDGLGEVSFAQTEPGASSTVSIVSYCSDNGYYTTDSCTGTFITEDVILTAAHCFTDNPNFKLIVTADNRMDLQSLANGNNQSSRKTTGNSIIPEYYKTYCSPYPEIATKNGEISRNSTICSIGDIALIKTVDKASSLGATVARISTDMPLAGSEINLVGYGRTFDGDKSTTLKKRFGLSQTIENSILNSIVTNSIAANYANSGFPASNAQNFIRDYNLTRFFPNLNVDKFENNFVLLGATSKDPTGVCHGDSGSSLFINIAPASQNPIYASIAVTHAGNCSNKISYNSFIGSYIDWIQKNLPEGENLNIVNPPRL